MKYLTAGLAPAKVLEIFEQICAIPHGSGNLDAITDFCEKFARDRHLEVIRDEAHNLIIKKPATAGYENAAPVIIQGHTDMVCEQAADCKKNMLTEGLDLCLDGDMLYAQRSAAMTALPLQWVWLFSTLLTFLTPQWKFC